MNMSDIWDDTVKVTLNKKLPFQQNAAQKNALFFTLLCLYVKIIIIFHENVT